MTKEEKEVVQALKVLGFEYIARDKVGDLYAYASEPDYDSKYCYYVNGYEHISLDDNLFEFIADKECKAIKEIDLIDDLQQENQKLKATLNFCKQEYPTWIDDYDNEILDSYLEEDKE